MNKVIYEYVRTNVLTLDTLTGTGSTKNKIYFFYLSISELPTEFKSGLRKIIELAVFDLFQIEHCAFYVQLQEKLSKCPLDQFFEFFFYLFWYRYVLFWGLSALKQCISRNWNYWENFSFGIFPCILKLFLILHSLKQPKKVNIKAVEA